MSTIDTVFWLAKRSDHISPLLLSRVVRILINWSVHASKETTSSFQKKSKIIFYSVFGEKPFGMINN